MARVGMPVTFAIHNEPDRRIILLFFSATLDGAEPRAVEGQAMAWVEPEDLARYPTPPADAALVADLAEGDGDVLLAREDGQWKIRAGL